MNPEKSMEAQLRHQVDFLSQQVAEYRAKLTAAEAQKQKKQKQAERVARAKISAAKVVRYSLYSILIALGAAIVIYCLFWLFEPEARETYKGKVVSVEIDNKTKDSVSAEECEISKKNGKLEYKNCDAASATKTTTDYILQIVFLDGDDDLRRMIFSQNRRGWRMPWNQKKLPFPKYLQNSRLFVGKGKPYIGCEVEVYDLRGKWLHSRSSAEFVANASMCKGPPSPAPPTENAESADKTNNAKMMEKTKPTSQPAK